MDYTELNRGLSAILPEILMLLLGFVLISGELIARDTRKRALGFLATIGMIGVLVVVVLQSVPLFAENPDLRPALGNMVRVDLVAQLFRMMFVTAAALTCLITIDFKPLQQGGEFYGLIVFATLGMSLMATANDIIMLYVALETTSISLYLLAGYMRHEPRSSEAGMKYFLFGAFTSTVLLYGLSLLYGFTGQTEFGAIVKALNGLGAEGTLPVVTALILVMVGFGFKVAAVPFHMWTPDVYEGGPTPFTAFVSVASKAAGFVVLIRVATTVFVPVHEQWVGIVAGLSVLTMTLGNLLAIPQRNIKRLLAYSSIAQAGYVLIGVASASRLGVSAALFYLAAYVLTNLAAFIVIEAVTNRLGTEDLYKMAGLARRSFWLSMGMLLAMLSLAGVPPLAGFFAKFYIFQAAVDAGLIWLAVIGVLNAILGLYYYLIVIRVLFVDRGEEEISAGPIAGTLRLGLLLSSFGILFLGVFATPWYTLAEQAAQTFLK